MKKVKKKDFEQRFAQEEEELLALINESVCGATDYGEYLKPSVQWIASVNVKTGMLSEEKGILEWLIPNVPDRNGWGYDLKQYGIYHIKARKNIPIKLQSYMDPITNNCYMLTEILDDKVSDERLEAIKARISKPVRIQEEGIGIFELNHQNSFFEGQMDWLGAVCSVYLETDQENGDTAKEGLAVLKELSAKLKQWDSRLRKFAAQSLTDLANEWLQEKDGEDAATITEEDFAARLKISELMIYPEGDMVVYYHDDAMFWGHTVEVNANISGEILDADIAG